MFSQAQSDLLLKFSKEVPNFDINDVRQSHPASHGDFWIKTKPALINLIGDYIFVSSDGIINYNYNSFEDERIIDSKTAISLLKEFYKFRNFQ